MLHPKLGESPVIPAEEGNICEVYVLLFQLKLGVSPVLRSILTSLDARLDPRPHISLQVKHTANGKWPIYAYSRRSTVDGLQ